MRSDPLSAVRGVDKLLVWCPTFLLGAGVLFVYSADSQGGGFGENGASILAKQGLWVVLGLALAFAAMRIPYPRLTGLSYWLYACALLGLLAVLVAGKNINGATRWLKVGPLSVQPSEFAKLALVFALARYLSMPGRGRTVAGMLGAVALVVPPLALIVVQPDLDTALLLLPVLLSMLWVSGIPWRNLGLLAMAGGVFIAAYAMLWAKPYQRQRLQAYAARVLDYRENGRSRADLMRQLELREDYQRKQAEIAVGSGRFLGRGYLNGTQNRLNLIPMSVNDFIFAVAAEEFGFLGSMALLGLYAGLIGAGFWVAWRTEDPFGRLWATGFTSLLAVQTFLNLGVVLGLLPVMGMPLPLLSAGGSSLVTSLAGVGMLVNVGIHRVPSLARKD